MKKNIILLLCAVMLGAGCKTGGKAASGDVLDEDTSYAFGMIVAQEFNLPGVTLNYDAFLKGYQDALREDTRLEFEAAIDLIRPVYMTVLENQEAAFLAENREKPGITVTDSGLQYEVINQGTGEKPVIADTVRVHYRGTLTNGRVFDSSYDRGEPAEFPLEMVIPGWIEGLQLMNEGGAYRFYIPSNLAYGAEGSDAIPPYAPLIFEVELLSIINQ